MDSHMTFHAESSEDLYTNIADLVMVFFMSLLVEWMSHTTCLSNFPYEHNFRVGLIQTGLSIIRITAAYFVMLAVMSFDAGILSAAVAGRSLGFMIFGNRFWDGDDELGYRKPLDLPPLNC